MKNLTLHPLGDIDEVASPVFKASMDLTTPATAVFTDFSIYHPFDLHYKTPAREGMYLMQVAHVRLKFVVDDNGHFLGIVSTQELNNQEIIKKVAAGFKEDELTVGSFMKPKTEVSAISYEELQQATIGDVLRVLQKHNRQHCLVVNQDNNKIQGIISSSDIARQLRMPSDLMSSPDFIDVFKVKRPAYLDKKREHVSRTIS
jgi:predicted transcriptional regulator